MNQILKIEEVFYPLEEAVQKAAEQNVVRDHRNHGTSASCFEELSPADQKKYLSEARTVLLDFGKNYVPVYPENKRICLAHPESK